MADNAADVIDIEGSSSELFALAGLGVLGIVGVGFYLIRIAPTDPITRAIEILGFFIIVLCTLIWLWRGLFDRGPVVTITPQGICDRRVCTDIIP